MYVKPLLYRVYSVIKIVISLISFVFSIVAIVRINDVVKYISDNFISIDYIGVLTIVLAIFVAVISLLSALIEFFAMINFAELIDYERSKYKVIVKKVLPAEVYKIYGIIMFTLNTIFVILGSISLIVTNKLVGFLHVVSTLAIVAGTVLAFALYYVHYLRYKSICTLMKISVGDNAMQTDGDLASIKPEYLHIYCNFLWYVFIIFSIVSVIFVFISFGTFKALLGVSGAFVAVAVWILFAILELIEISILGCFADDIGTMVEHYQYNRRKS